LERERGGEGTLVTGSIGRSTISPLFGEGKRRKKRGEKRGEFAIGLTTKFGGKERGGEKQIDLQRRKTGKSLLSMSSYTEGDKGGEKGKKGGKQHPRDHSPPAKPQRGGRSIFTPTRAKGCLMGRRGKKRGRRKGRIRPNWFKGGRV